MLYFSNPDYPSSGNNLTVKYIQTSQRKSMPHYAAAFPILCRLCALLLALAFAPAALQAQDWDQINGRDKVHDPTGAWLITAGGEQFTLITFHRGGTVTEDIQGEYAFDPASVNPPTPPGNIQTSAQHGVWQKTGRKTFAASLVAIEAGNDAKNFISVFFRFDKVQYTGKLSESAIRWTLPLCLVLTMKMEIG